MNFVDKLLQTNSHVHIHDDKREFVEETIQSLINDGRSQLHIVADFDFTLTVYEKDGVVLPSTYAVIEGNEQVKLPDGSLLRDQTSKLRAKYHPIEYDVQMSIEEKVPYMIEWYQQAQSLLLNSNLNRSMCHQLVRQSKMELRKGVKQFVTQLLQSHTPILIFSAGLGDVIEIFLEQEIPSFKENHQSTHIVSNFLQYDANGKLISFNKKLIHPFNKNEYEIQDTPYFRSILHRPNVILFGDTLGDVGMIGGMKNLKHILKIGYLNRSTPTKLDVYKQVFDIVICDDSTFDVPNVILNAI